MSDVPEDTWTPISAPAAARGPIAGSTPGTPAHRAALARARRTVAVGAVLFLGGVGLTVGTYANAASSPQGGHYVVAYGPAIAGILIVVRGIRALRATRRVA